MLRLKFIGQQIIILAFITGIINVYAFEYWCNVRLAAIAATHSVTTSPSHAIPHKDAPRHSHTHQPGAHSNHEPGGPVHSSGSEHASGSSHHHPKAGNHEANEKDAGCCKDETTHFFSSLQVPSLTKIHFAPLDLPTLFPVWLESFLLAFPKPLRYSWPFHPDVGLRPKIPDIRIFLCSLTI